MDAAIIFSVPEPSVEATIRCRQAIAQLGAPLRSDSGHFVTGVVTSGHNNIELRVTWLDDRGGTQITVNAAHEGITEEELMNAAERFKYEYLHKTTARRQQSFKLPLGSILVVASCVTAIAIFIFTVLKHK